MPFGLLNSSESCLLTETLRMPQSSCERQSQLTYDSAERTGITSSNVTSDIFCEGSTESSSEKAATRTVLGSLENSLSQTRSLEARMKCFQNHQDCCNVIMHSRESNCHDERYINYSMMQNPLEQGIEIIECEYHGCNSGVIDLFGRISPKRDTGESSTPSGFMNNPSAVLT